MRRHLALFVCLLPLAACSDDIPTGDPQSRVKIDRFGEKLPDEVAAGPGNAKYWAKAVMSGYEHPTYGDLPARVEPLMRTGGCSFPPPKPGAKLALVTTSESPVDAPVYSIDAADIRKRADLYIREWGRKGEAPRAADADSGLDGFHIANVVVTDTSAPVHLVLAGWSRVLWNIHAAEGVTISGVAITDQSAHTAIANLPPDVPVSAMTGDQAKNCKAIAFRPPGPSWSTVQRAKGSQNPVDKEIVDNRAAYYRSFNSWFRNSFGSESETVAIGAERATNFLVGPVPPPEARVAYRTLRGSQMKITSGGTLVFADIRDAYRNKNDELVRAQAEKLAGGNLARLNKPQ
jgi:hypothetical protein